MFSNNRLQILDNLEACRRVQTARWLVEEKDLWGCNKATSYAQASFLTSAYTFAKRCSDDAISLIAKTDSGDQLVYSSHTSMGGNGA